LPCPTRALGTTLVSRPAISRRRRTWIWWHRFRSGLQDAFRLPPSTSACIHTRRPATPVWPPQSDEGGETGWRLAVAAGWRGANADEACSFLFPTVRQLPTEGLSYQAEAHRLNAAGHSTRRRSTWTCQVAIGRFPLRSRHQPAALAASRPWPATGTSARLAATNRAVLVNSGKPMPDLQRLRPARTIVLSGAGGRLQRPAAGIWRGAATRFFRLPLRASAPGRPMNGAFPLGRLSVHL
jgi:hypothetical protein